MKVGFLTFEQHQGKANAGSSRIRCDYLIKYWGGDAERFVMGQKYDVIVFQKAYWTEYAKKFDGIKIFDICDADWLHWGYHLKEMIDAVDGITCSTMEIAKFIVQLTDKPVAVIPDRVDLETLPPAKEHYGDARSVAWFGYAENFPQLNGAVPAIRKRDLELIVVSTSAYIPPASERAVEIQNLPWKPNTWMTDVQKADIVVLPRYTHGRFKYKSNNKVVQSWALGLPVAFLDTDLDRFLNESERRKEVDTAMEIVKNQYDARISVKELKEFIDEISVGHKTSLGQ